jgi:hypothetical protein
VRSRGERVTRRTHFEQRVRPLYDTLEAILAEARALRRRLELLAVARQIAFEQLRPAGGSDRALDLSHANRVF